MTHLHWDHCANVELFPRARILVSHRGWRDVVAPEHRELVPQDGSPRPVLSHLIDEAWERVEFLPEEVDILAGQEVFWVGGHSPCSQAVKISTTKGRAIITGDTAFLYGNIEERILVAICTNLAECCHTLDWISREGDLILANHDPLVLGCYPGGVVAWNCNRTPCEKHLVR